MRLRDWQAAATLEELQALLLDGPSLFPPDRPALDAPFDAVPFCFFDVETTGLDPERGDRIVEIAAVRIDPGGRERRHVEILDPRRDIPDEVRAIHAIRPEQVRSCRRFAAGRDEILSLFDGAVAVGHNVGFDLRFLRWELRRAGADLPPLRVLDTWCLARRWCHLRSYSLESVARHLEISPRDLHKALDDVLTTRAVLERLAPRIEPPAARLVDLLNAMLAPLPESVKE
ncbi:MAG: exonuclease domain-containing protein [Candidatus Eisenbacteria bacterium]